MLIRHRLLHLFIALLTLSQTLSGKPTEVAIVDDRFVVNDRLEDLYGIRVASASQSDENTEALISSLDEYKAHGVNAVTFFLQGSSGGFSDPFNEDGTRIAPEHLRRIHQIIEACDVRGMVAIVGIFYQRVIKNLENTRHLNSTEAIIEAVRTTTNALRDHHNVIVNIANEQNSGYYRDVEMFNFNDPEQIIRLCQIVKETDPKRLVGGGGYHDESNVIIGRSPSVDVLLFDTFPGDVEAEQDSGWHYEYFRENGVTGKPIVNVEIFGGWTKVCVSESGQAGVYSPEQRRIHLEEIDAAFLHPGLSVFFHSNPWCQGPSMGLPTHFDLAGQGTSEDPGIRWWFEYVRQKRDSVAIGQNGVILIEAASCAFQGWEQVDDDSESALIDRSERGEGWISTQIDFKEIGDYYLYLMCKYTGDSLSERNDCFVTLDDQRLFGSDGTSRPDGIRTHSSKLAWSYLPKGPGAHTPTAIRDDPVYFTVAHSGIYTLRITSRSEGFTVRKMLLVHRDRIQNPKEIHSLIPSLKGL